MSGESAPDMATQPTELTMEPTIEIMDVNKSKKLQFILHGEVHSVKTEGLKPETTLAQYIRNTLRLTGTKYMCNEGGCGVCIVAVTVENPQTKVRETFSVNSCMVSILSCNGWDITTIEGLGSRQKGYHPLQDRFVVNNATQCGFCTPGMIMNAHALIQSGKNTMADIEDSLSGNICRCTGYRPILQALKSLATDSDEALLGISDIEDMKLCKKDGCEQTCPTPCVQPAKTPLYYDLNPSDEDDNDLLTAPTDNSKKVWYKVSTIKQVFNVINARENANRDYRFVAGNTAKGVYKCMDEKDYYIDINGVAELRGHSLGTKKLTVGANCTLKEMIDICKSIPSKDEGFHHLTKIANHLDMVASTSIRNIATLAGNLAIKNAHKEFPSDVFLLLEIMNAKIIIDRGNSIETLSLPSFLNYNLRKCIIRRIEIPPLDKSFIVETYKIMPRAQGAHAILAAAFCVRIQNDMITAASFVFSGVQPTFIHASNAEKYIVNKKLLDNNNINVLLNTLSSEINPDHRLPDATADFRKQLAISLAYKFILSIAPETRIPANIRSGAKKLTRPALSTSKQEYTVDQSMFPVGKPVNKLEAQDQTSGSAKYTFDIHDEPQQLFAKFFGPAAPAGSKITGIDGTKALELPGCVAVYTAADIPGINSFMPNINPFFYNTNEHLFIPIGEGLRFYGQPVGIVVATSMDIAVRAAELVEVKFDKATSSPYLNIPMVLSAAEGIQKMRVHHVNTIVPQNQDRDAPIKFEGTINLGAQYHYAMETQCVQVIPQDDGALSVQASTQYIDIVQFAISDCLKIPANKIGVKVKRVGGAFGSKLARSQWTACAAALAASKLNRPVKMALTLEENMNIIGKRNPAYATYKVGTDANGKIMYLDLKFYSDVGAYNNCVPVMQTLDALTNTYNPSTFDIEYNIVITDTPASTWTRAPGAVEGTAVLENILEHISYKCGKDPLDVRLANINYEKHGTLKTMIDKFQPWADYRARRKACNDFNAINRWRKRGIAIMPMSITLSFLVNHGSQVTIYHIDGTVCIRHGGIDMGQGVNTKAAQVVAYELGVPIEMITVKETDNFTTPNNFGSGAALTTESICMSLKAACTNLNARIAWAAGFNNLPPETPWQMKVKNAWALGQNLTENNMWVANPADPPDYVIYGVGCTEVEVDLLTGQHIVTRVDLMEDAGNSSNPFIDIGQVEGAYMMSLGYFTCEQIVYDHDGCNVTNNTWTYKAPGAKDIPVDFRVNLPTGQPNPKTPYNNKATSEPPTCLGFSVPLAIKDALRSARTQSNPDADAWVPIDGPMTVEKIFRSGLYNQSQFRI